MDFLSDNKHNQALMPKKKNRHRVICVGVISVCDGLLLRVLPNRIAAEHWINKHIKTNPKLHVFIRNYSTRKSVDAEFARQMKLGLTDEKTICDLINHCGIATNWKPNK